MEIPLYQIDAFTQQMFAGNPAAVCPLETWLEDRTLQLIASENNLAETAFFIPGEEGGYQLRWFTPTCEVDLCGHATLASAWVIMKRLDPLRFEVEFQTRSGELRVTREGDLFALDFPARPPRRVELSRDLAAALGAEPDEVWTSRDTMAVFDDEQQIRSLCPDMNKLGSLDTFAVIVTAPGKGADFVSRFFAPARGISEDPVTGSAHCTLIPFWADRLGKTKLTANQISRRGGELECELKGDRVSIAGYGVLYSTGTIHLPD